MEIGIGKALEYSGLGIAIVFVLIIVLMIVVKIMSAIITGAVAARDKAAAKVSADGRGCEAVRRSGPGRFHDHGYCRTSAECAVE